MIWSDTMAQTSGNGNQERARAIFAYLQGAQEKMVAFLRELALAESPTTVPDAQARVQALLREPLEDLGFAVQVLPGQQSGGHLYATRPQEKEGGPRQLLLGHSDTVWPIGTVEEMPVALRGRKMVGPGVYDMKAGLTQMIFALRALHELGFEPAVAPTVFINSDEETGSDESTSHIRRFARAVERVFVLEPSLGSEGRLKTARKGVGRFDVVARGRAAHAGLDPEKGRSAILELSYVIQKLFALNDPAAGVNVNVGRVVAGLRPNVVAPEGRAEIDVRVPTREAARHVEEAIYALKPETPGVTLEITGEVGRPPLERTPRNRALWELARARGRDLGLALQEGTAGGGSDGNTTSPLAATLDGLGAIGDGAHASHEFVYVDAMPQRAALLALLLLAPSLETDPDV